jgi:rubredoxin
MLSATSKQDHRRGGARPGRLWSHRPNLAPVFGAPRAIRRYAAAVTTETQTKQLWMCTSCGFIYDPDEGDPDGGIPPGTPFEEIPDSWFCPVCGARKADFEPYED